MLNIEFSMFHLGQLSFLSKARDLLFIEKIACRFCVTYITRAKRSAMQQWPHKID